MSQVQQIDGVARAYQAGTWCRAYLRRKGVVLSRGQVGANPGCVAIEPGPHVAAALAALPGAYMHPQGWVIFDMGLVESLAGRQFGVV